MGRTYAAGLLVDNLRNELVIALWEPPDMPCQVVNSHDLGSWLSAVHLHPCQPHFHREPVCPCQLVAALLAEPAVQLPLRLTWSLTAETGLAGVLLEKADRETGHNAHPTAEQKSAFQAVPLMHDPAASALGFRATGAPSMAQPLENSAQCAARSGHQDQSWCLLNLAVDEPPRPQQS